VEVSFLDKKSLQHVSLTDLIGLQGTIQLMEPST